MMASDAEQLERLLSEQADGDLDAAQQASVRRAVAEDRVAGATARQYARLNELLAGWRTLPEGIDWQAAARGVSLRVSQAGEGAELARARRSGSETETSERCDPIDADERTLDDRAVDDFVTRAAGPLPEVDWAAFKSRVSAAVRREAATPDASGQGMQHRWRRGAAWALRVGAPLAAAAVIAFAVWGPWADRPFVHGPSARGSALVVVSLERPESAGRVLVTLDVVPGGLADEPAPPRGGVAIAIGPAGTADADLPDLAIFY